MISFDFFRKGVPVILGILLVVVFFGCEEYQKEEFTISDLDAKACVLLLDSLSDTISTSLLTNFDTTWVVDTVIYNSIPEILDSLETNNIMITPGVSYTIVTPEDMDTNYIFYQDSLIGGDGVNVVFYFNDYLSINLVGENGTVIDEKSKAIPLETVYDCPELKTRIVYKLVEEGYLVELVKINQTLSDTLRAVILHEQ
ncbi:hypothetical protein CH333_08950 [candidate division WOR-3 bacterium JGI_Cruoil_03_44_89]|uniref:Uncharacterized protein n=1 Tax=candidate division WOR-3 bacterium JGI_Cruoil_03_44_89 TaxID=1973748 RepID=A0A235BP64_UNCW3|nr:MAG: hypothetical protein CH333_08950 [candidate division WOR-3 bacterium JGI_Cruoil_03_44_89]